MPNFITTAFKQIANKSSSNHTALLGLLVFASNFVVVEGKDSNGFFDGMSELHGICLYLIASAAAFASISFEHADEQAEEPAEFQILEIEESKVQPESVSITFSQRVTTLEQGSQTLSEAKLSADLREKLVILESDLKEFNDEFICPLNLVVMDCPVTVSSGISYDQAAFKNYLLCELNQNKPVIICPMTHKPLIETIHSTLNVNVLIKNRMEKQLKSMENRLLSQQEEYHSQPTNSFKP